MLMLINASTKQLPIIKFAILSDTTVLSRIRANVRMCRTQPAITFCIARARVSAKLTQKGRVRHGSIHAAVGRPEQCYSSSCQAQNRAIFDMHKA